MKKITVLIFILIGVALNARTPVLIHSHNDYCRRVPFWQAYSQGVYSIEADVFLKDGALLVGHETEDLKPDMTFEELYVKPILTVYSRNGGKPYYGHEGLQLMIELKSETVPTLSAVTDLLSKFPEVFNPDVNVDAVRVVITGRTPDPERFADWPSFINFDGDIDETYTAEELERVPLFSVDFQRFSSWNGKGSIIDAEESRLREVIDRVHEMGKDVRFWGAPEGITPYYVFLNMGIDYVNTDHPEACAAFFNDFSNKNFRIGDKSSPASGVTGTKKLDRTTRDFSGFKNERLTLSERIPVYEPTFRSDDKNIRIDNVIFLIGDGMGLNQITAAEYANNGLSLLALKSIGLQINNSKDEFTTDSAAAGSALATGESHSNRHISSSDNGEEYPSLSDWFHEKGKSTGIVTLGNIADATPAAFYGHCVERDSSDILTRFLLDGRLDLLCGSGTKDFTRRKDGIDMIGELGKKYSFIQEIERINEHPGKVICIDERMEDAAEESNLTLLAKATSEAIEKLTRQSGKGFFLMVEGAKIDYAGHSKCLPGSVLETLSFDLAVAEALRFADKDGHTLVVVTADHETGGLTLLDGDRDSGRIMGVYVTDDHTPAMLPVFAYGPHSSKFNGTFKNTEIARTIKSIVK